MRSPASCTTEVERVREKFLTVGSVDAVRSVDEDILRPSVLDSWRRSQVLRVHPDRVELPYVREPNRGSRLARAAGPVLQRVADDLAAQAVGVLLTSTNGVVLERTAPEVSILNAWDTTSIARALAWLKRRRVPTGLAPRWRLAGPHSSVAASTTSDVVRFRVRGVADP
jgi:sigma-54 dependent transcriptional regulator, acetoin dehydrogenase operon transcriptional activator AcoR